jgi:hypothetical protein
MVSSESKSSLIPISCPRQEITLLQVMLASFTLYQLFIIAPNSFKLQINSTFHWKPFLTHCHKWFKTMPFKMVSSESKSSSIPMSKTRNNFASSHALLLSLSIKKWTLKSFHTFIVTHISFLSHHLCLEMVTVVRKTKFNEMSVNRNPHYDKPPWYTSKCFSRF